MRGNMLIQEASILGIRTDPFIPKVLSPNLQVITRTFKREKGEIEGESRAKGTEGSASCTQAPSQAARGWLESQWLLSSHAYINLLLY